MVRLDPGTGTWARATAILPTDMSATSGFEFEHVDSTQDPEALLAYLDLTSAARARSQDGGLPVEFQVGDAQQLPFDADTFDAARAERVLQHLLDPARALAELIRVTRPGRPVVAMDPDYDTLVVDSPDRMVTREIVRAYSDSVPNGWMGRRLPALFLEAGLREVQVVPVAAVFTDFALASQIFWLAAATERAVASGNISEDQAAGWLAWLEESDRQGRFFSGVTAYIVAGRKPEPS